MLCFVVLCFLVSLVLVLVGPVRFSVVVCCVAMFGVVWCPAPPAPRPFLLLPVACCPFALPCTSPLLLFFFGGGRGGVCFVVLCRAPFFSVVASSVGLSRAVGCCCVLCCCVWRCVVLRGPGQAPGSLSRWARHPPPSSYERVRHMSPWWKSFIL